MTDECQYQTDLESLMTCPIDVLWSAIDAVYQDLPARPRAWTAVDVHDLTVG